VVRTGSLFAVELHGAMSHAALWRCPNEACPVILGEVRNGVLDVFAPRPRVGVGRVAVECPSCGRVRVWELDRPAEMVK
jgi:pimeloyl-ACP methyl ester carboxylesterase